MIEIDGARALSLLEQVVKGNKDFIYEPPNGVTCVYEQDGKSSCLIGQVLHLAGVSVETLDWMDTMGAMSALDADDLYGLEEQGVSPTEEARRILAAAQDVQDVRRSWGEALDAAREAANATHGA